MLLLLGYLFIKKRISAQIFTDKKSSSYLQHKKKIKNKGLILELLKSKNIFDKIFIEFFDAHCV